MNEDSSNKNKNNKKHYEYDEEYTSDNEIIYVNYIDEEEERIKEDYYIDTIYMIQKNLLNFVENKSLPLCEYLSINSIVNFINDNIEY